LAYYLKALGVLRIVAEQADPNVRGWWQDEHFCLLSRLSKIQLQDFFLDAYRPTAIFNPWGGRSGFYSGGSETGARAALERLELTSSDRLKGFQEAIAAVREAVNDCGGSKPNTENKSALLLALRNRIRGPSSEWLGTVVALVGDTHRSPALLGTGGNEGSGSYTSAYFSALVACVVERSQDHALGLFLSDHPTDVTPVERYAWGSSFGQFIPNGGGSAWDLLLTIEGALVYRSGVASRSRAGSAEARFLASPFFFPPLAVGSGSVAVQDEYAVQKGKSNPGRGEQWFPLWPSPATLSEVKACLSEGRCAIGRRRSRGALEAARAVARLGVARGLVAFVRYGYLQRNNLATHFAVPLGRVPVVARDAELTDGLRGWLDVLHRSSKAKGTPFRLAVAARRLSDAVFSILTDESTALGWQHLLLAAVHVEEVQTAGVAVNAGPIPFLAPAWLSAADDGTPEWRLACALGSAARDYNQRGRAIDSVRHHWLSLDPTGRHFQVAQGRLAKDPRVVTTGHDTLADLAALVERRLLESGQRGERRLCLVSAPGFEARPEDIRLVIGGRVDVSRIWTLARALMAIRWDTASTRASIASQAATEIDETWAALRLALLPWPLTKDRDIPADETIVRRLTAGDAIGATEAALRRLRAAGLRPPIRAGCADETVGRLWAAALAFPISRATAHHLARNFEPFRQ
jgi:CRISPR-associated protein Csx17